MYDFIAWCTSKECFDKAKRCVPSDVDMRVLGICHNIIALSCGIQTPITFGLGVQLHHDHGSKELIELLSSVDHFVKKKLGNEPTKSFWEPLKKCTVSTFADMKNALSNDKDRKLIIDTEVLFQRLLAVCRSRDVDLRNVLQYELATVPPALFHDDGTMRKTNKADLAQRLESSCLEVLVELLQIPSSTSSAYLIDGMGMVQSLMRTSSEHSVIWQKWFSWTSYEPILGVE